MTILVCGSLAFDTIMVFPDQFQKHILPDQIHILNVVVHGAGDAARVRRHRRATSRYNLKLLGEDPLVMATVGHDFGPYAERLRAARHLAAPRAACGQPIHRPGVYHHRHRRQPDHRLPPRRDVFRAPEPDRRRAGRAARDRLARRPPGHGRARARSRRGEDSATSSTRARACRCSRGPDLLAMMAGADALTVNDYEARVVEQKTRRKVERARARRWTRSWSRAAPKARASTPKGRAHRRRRP